MKRVKCSELSAVTFEHYLGSNQPIPPAFKFQEGKFYITEVGLQESILKALQSDVEWVSSLSTKDNEEDGDPKCDWSGYMAKKASKVGYKGKPTQFVVGPLVDSIQLHPDDSAYLNGIY